MLLITETATKRALELINENARKTREKLRMKLVLDNTGCAGTKYGIQLTDEINKRDIVHKRSGLEIVIPEDFYEYFRNATIDVDETNKFKITVKSDSPEKTI